ncbi:protein serine/threonine phosphatase [Parafrankia sp. EAN1pec]|nr:protein serine/threonine phosphatase [Frankia sp. EAN1pec]
MAAEAAGAAEATREPVQESTADRPWRRHSDGRWIVGDAGRQPLVQVVAPREGSPQDTALAEGEARQLVYRAASVRGISHQERGQPRQDAFTVRTSADGGWLVGCIADGVSQAPLSHQAAETVCAHMTEAIIDVTDRKASLEAWLDWDRVVQVANLAVLERAHPVLRRKYRHRNELDRLAALENGLPTAAEARGVMSTTALAFIVGTEPDDYGRHLVMLGNAAGDCSAFLLREGRWTALTEVKNEGASVVSGVVRSLPADTPSVRVIPATLSAGDALVVMTDGLGDPLGSATGVVSDFLAEGWSSPPALPDFAARVSFYRRTFADDRTAVVVWAGQRWGAP